MLNVLLTGVLGFLAWIALSVVDLKTDTAVIAVKVAENHKMLTPLWQDYLQRNRNDNLAWFNESASLEAGK